MTGLDTTNATQLKKKKKKKGGGGGGGIGEHISALDRKTKQQTINQTNKTTAVTTTTTDQEKNTLQVQSRDFAIKALLLLIIFTDIFPVEQGENSGAWVFSFVNC